MTLETTCAAVSHWVLWRKTNVFQCAGVWHGAAIAAAGRGGWAAAGRFIPARQCCAEEGAGGLLLLTSSRGVLQRKVCSH